MGCLCLVEMDSETKMGEELSQTQHIYLWDWFLGQVGPCFCEREKGEHQTTKVVKNIASLRMATRSTISDIGPHCLSLV